MPPAASSTAYPGRGCMETGYVDGCRWFGDRTKGPLAAVHESVSLIDCARIFSRLRRKPVKLDQKVTGICPTGASARDCANSAPAVDTMTPLPNFDPIAVGDEVAGLSSKMIAVGSIGVPPERMRKLRHELVDKLAKSIEKEGLLQPIIVRPLPDHRGYVLIAGHHRLEAVRKLKHDTIRAEILEGLSADQARVAEIDENLIRADLTPSERAVHHAERKALYLKLHPETKHGGAPGKAGGGKKAKDAKLASFVKDTAKKTGKAKRTIARDVSRGEKIDPQALADLAGTCLDNGTELDALATLPAAEQRSLAEAAKRGEKVSAIACGPEAPKTSDGTGKVRSKPSRRKKADLALR